MKGVDEGGDGDEDSDDKDDPSEEDAGDAVEIQYHKTIVTKTPKMTKIIQVKRMQVKQRQRQYDKDGDDKDYPCEEDAGCR